MKYFLAVVVMLMFVGCDSSYESDYSSDYNSGDSFPLGTTTVTYTVLDDSGNSAIRTFSVTVVDTGGAIALLARARHLR